MCRMYYQLKLAVSNFSIEVIHPNIYAKPQWLYINNFVKIFITAVDFKNTKNTSMATSIQSLWTFYFSVNVMQLVS